MTLYFTNPPKPLNWKSPRTLSLTTARNSMGNDYAPIGHVNVRLKCESPNAQGVTHILTGMSRKDKKESKRIVKKKKIGLGTLFYDFRGTLDSSEAAQKEIEDAAQEKRLNGMKIQINEKVCQKLIVYVDEWIKNGSYEHYGSGLNTGIGEGAGCAAFGVEFMKLAGLEEYTGEWFRTVIVPNALIGTKSNKVSMTKMAFTKIPWGKKPEDGVTLRQYDPELMNDWVEKMVKEHQEGSQYKLSQELGADFIELDATKVKPVSEAMPLLIPLYEKKSSEEQTKQWSAIKVN
jgi:hypothetical protein